MVWVHRGECPRCRGNLGAAQPSVYDPETPVCALCRRLETLESTGKAPPFAGERYWRPNDQTVKVTGIRLNQQFGNLAEGDVIRIPGIPGVIHLHKEARPKVG